MMRKEHKKNLYILHSSVCMLQFTLRELRGNMQDSAGLSKVRWEDVKNRLKHNTSQRRQLWLAVLTNEPQLMSPQRHLN